MFGFGVFFQNYPKTCSGRSEAALGLMLGLLNREKVGRVRVSSVELMFWYMFGVRWLCMISSSAHHTACDRCHQSRAATA